MGWLSSPKPDPAIGAAAQRTVAIAEEAQAVSRQELARARERIRVRLGLPLGVSEARVVAAAATRSGRSPEQVGVLLYGPEPTTDAHLVALGHDLEALMVEVGGA